MTLRRWRKKEWANIWGGHWISTPIGQVIGFLESIPNSFNISKNSSLDCDIKNPTTEVFIMSSTDCDIKNPTISAPILSEITNIGTPIALSNLSIQVTLTST
jgi:hypothetical protein